MKSITLMVAVLGILCLLLIYHVATKEPPSPFYNSHLTINLASPVVEERIIENDTCWDATINVNKMSPKDDDLSWKDAYVIITGADGTPLKQYLVLHPNDPGEYKNLSDGRLVVQAWYIDITDDLTKMQATDKVAITGMDRAYEGATIEIFREDDLLGDVRLPSAFE